MDLTPLVVKTNCIYKNDVLYENIRNAMGRGLPTIGEHHAHDGVAVLVGSGPSIKNEIESIKKHKEENHPIVAIKDAHDWLMDNGIVPDYAIAVDPQENRWNCFLQKNKETRYLIASQCHSAMFEHLYGLKVFLWHLYMEEGQTYPPNSLLVTGGTTSGLRAITLFYSMGFRKVELYGYDSCLSGDDLRINGTNNGDEHVDVIVGENGRRFITTPPMAAQASEFQNIFIAMPDIDIVSHGDGLITEILKVRMRQ